MSDMYEERQRQRVALMRELVERGRRHDAATARLGKVADGWKRDAAGGRPPALAAPAVRHDDGFVFAAAADREETARREHQSRRRRAEAEVASHDRTYAFLWNLYGSDEAERLMS